MAKPYLYEFRVRRVRRSCASELTKIEGPGSAAAAFRPFVEGEAREIFLCASLDVRGQLLGVEVVAIGSLSTVEVAPREIFRAAILANAAGIVVGHNHPSGNPEPSPADIALTRRLREAGELLGIPVLDHVVLGVPGEHVSIYERTGWHNE